MTLEREFSNQYFVSVDNDNDRIITETGLMDWGEASETYTVYKREYPGLHITLYDSTDRPVVWFDPPEE